MSDSFIKRLIIFYQENGTSALLSKIFKGIIRRLKNKALAAYFRLAKPKYFSFQGHSYVYLWHYYNVTWENERTVEIPICMKFVRDFKNKKILEIGNTLNYYSSFPHDVVDKYEIASGVINEDVVDFSPDTKYDLIISVSTMEHVGWDEKPRQPEKILKAFNNLRENCLSLGGTMVVTMPLGFNSALDGFLLNKQLVFDEAYFMKRISKDNVWQEVDFDEVKNIRYGSPYPFANAVIIGIFKRGNQYVS